MEKAGRLTDVATAILSVCALVVTVLLIRREFFPPAASALSPKTDISIERNWQEYASVGHVLGDTAATVTIVEFADFECGFCRRFHVYTDSLRALGYRIRVVYRHYPVAGHRFAVAAARVSDCAAEQGQFSEMHANLYSYPDSFGIAPWRWFGEKSSIRDMPRFESCVQSRDAVPSLARDTVAANRLGIAGTPLLLVGQIRVNGLPPFDSLLAYVERSSRQ